MNVAGVKSTGHFLLSTRQRTNHHKNLVAIGNRGGQGYVGVVVAVILLAKEEPHKRAAFKRVMFADGAAELREPGLKRIKNAALRHRAGDFEFHFASNAR